MEQELKRKTMVIGHRNPDTDSICSAICYACLLYTSSHFMKYFKRYMGMPFTQYLNDFRLEKAAGFLRTTSLPVTDVAQKCGFDNISYFNRLFRKKYHGTPGEYRKDGDAD